MRYLSELMQRSSPQMDKFLMPEARAGRPHDLRLLLNRDEKLPVTGIPEDAAAANDKH